MSSVLSSTSEEDSGSDISSSSEDVSEDESDEEIVTIGGPKKPQIGRGPALGGAQDLQARISALLPQLQAANEQLTTGENGQNMENVADDEPHIEMDLGLGVLEEKQNYDSDASDSEDLGGKEDDYQSAEGDKTPVSSDTVAPGRNGRDTDAMRKLLGQQKGRNQPGIEDLG